MNSGPMLLRANVSRTAVLRTLGYGSGSAPPEDVGRRLDVLWHEALALLQPRGIIGVVDAKQLPVELFATSERVCVGVATIGLGLESEARRQKDAGETLDAQLLDAIGSVAADAAADSLNLKVCKWASANRLNATARVSPGYDEWPVAAQTALFAQLPEELLPVRLSEGQWLYPQKSVSFVIRLWRGVDPANGEVGRCSSCGLRDCDEREAT